MAKASLKKDPEVIALIDAAVTKAVKQDRKELSSALKTYVFPESLALTPKQLRQVRKEVTVLVKGANESA